MTIDRRRTTQPAPRNPRHRAPTTSWRAFQDRFPDDESCLQDAMRRRWPEGLRCARCGGSNVVRVRGRPTVRCRGCRRDHGITSEMAYRHHRAPLLTWYTVVWLLATTRRSISSHEVGRRVGLEQKTAWRMMNRILESLAASLSDPSGRDSAASTAYRQWLRRSAAIPGGLVRAESASSPLDQHALFGGAELEGWDRGPLAINLRRVIEGTHGRVAARNLHRYVALQAVHERSRKTGRCSFELVLEVLARG